MRVHVRAVPAGPHTKRDRMKRNAWQARGLCPSFPLPAYGPPADQVLRVLIDPRFAARGRIGVVGVDGLDFISW